MQIPDDRWARINDVLSTALALNPDERAAFLDKECAGEPEVREEVEALLRADAEGPGFLEGDAVSFAGPAYTSASPEETTDPGSSTRPGSRLAPGQEVGAYRLVEEIGRGGMSRVFRARRADGTYEQTVALKVLRLGLGSAEARRRFRLERQVLAGLSHPNIARLLDGGVTPEGRPYLVMEHVEGEAITEYCETHNCSLAERVRLLKTVAEALQYAHRTLVVHRDLKPANVLVTEDGTPTLLDFGIAKLLNAETLPGGEEGAPTVPATRAGRRPMTPAYAAPEQVEGEAVTVATDVYQLGVLGYELLTGRRPYRSAGRSRFEVERAVLEESPRRPSSAAQTNPSDASVESVPEDRPRELQGDLDAILLKALQKAPGDRYASAADVAEDLGRYQSGRPVEARPVTLGYRTRKFVRRHVVGTTAAVAGLVLVVGFVATLFYQRARTAQQRDRARRAAATAEQVSDFMVELFAAGNPEAEARELSAQELLRRGETRVDELSDQPAVQARMLEAMGRAHLGLDHYDRADSLLGRAVTLRRQIHKPPHEALATGLTHRADAAAGQGHVVEAESLARAALAMRRSLHGSDHPAVARSLNDIGRYLQEQRALAPAESLHHRALTILRETGGPERTTAETLERLATTLRDRGQPDSSVVLARRVLAMHRSRWDRLHSEVIAAEHTLAYSLRAAGRYDEGAARYRTVLEKQRARYGPEHPVLADTHNDLAYLRKQQGRPAAAVRHYRRALAIRRSALGPAHPKTTAVLQNLAGALWAQEAYGEVEGVLRDRVEALRTHAPADSGRLGTALGGLARFLAERGQFATAVGPMRDTYRLYRQQHGPEALYTILKAGELGAVLEALGRDQEAEPLLRRHYRTLRTQRDSILHHQNTYTRLDIVYNLRAMGTVFEQADLSTLARRYRRLREKYQS